MVAGRKKDNMLPRTAKDPIFDLSPLLTVDPAQIYALPCNLPILLRPEFIC